MTTRSKNKPAAKQVPKTPPGISLDPDPITAARTPGVDPLLGHQLPAAIIESTPTLTTTATSPLVPAPEVTLSILSGPVPLVELPDSGSIPSAPDIIPSPLAPDLCALFQQFMITTSEFKHHSIMDATTFRATMEHGLSYLKTDLCDNLVDQLKQAVIQEDSTLHPSSSAGARVQRPPTRQCPGQYYAVPDSDDSDGTYEVPQRSWERVHDNPFAIVCEHPFLQVVSRNNHCSKFKSYLTGSIKLKDDSLVALERFVDSIKAPPSDLVDTQEFSLDVGDKVYFETEPIVVPVTLPPIGTSLGITLAFDDDYCLCYLTSCDADSLFLQALQPYYWRNIYILTVNDSDPVTVDDTLAALKSCQVLHAMSRIEIGIVKRNSHHRTALE
jgi:hypothetical protein